MALRGVWTAERGEQKAQVLFFKKIDADPPSKFSSSEKGSPSVSLFKALRMGGLHAYRRFQPRPNARPDARMPDACKQPHWRAYPGARAHPFDVRISGYTRMSSNAHKTVCMQLVRAYSLVGCMHLRQLKPISAIFSNNLLSAITCLQIMNI